MTKNFDPHKHEWRCRRLCQRIREAYYRLRKDRAALWAEALKREVSRRPAYYVDQLELARELV